ncbi:3-hydroxyacyl-CoA dehydrogenase NAD-binding domain-containing protein [Vagococcus fessus]|nr:3-hydroxyacyl-CoA dehydrogenase NAD-binding domain-containing protein [Vagococcus fessus]
MTINKVGVIGLGVIGLSWSALMLAKGVEVHVYDIREDHEEGTKQSISQMLKSLGVSFSKVSDQLVIEKSVEDMAAHVEFIQENGPENLAFKKDLYATIEKYGTNSLIIASSSSGIPAGQMNADMSHPERLIIGHPFNPPHMIPLVEVSPSAQTSQLVIDQTLAFYEQLGKSPVVIKKEIPGFVANRLQTAIFQECIALVRDDVVDVKELDTIIEKSLGIRWASGGPFLSFHLGGGPQGFEGFLKHLGPALNQGFKDISQVELTEELQEKLIEQVKIEYGMDLVELAEHRDIVQGKIIDACD